MVVSLASAYETIVKDPVRVFYQDWKGNILPFENPTAPRYSGGSIAVYSGSFNPLHDGHKAIHAKMSKRGPTSPRIFYEMAITRRDKDPVPLEDLEVRLKQFVGHSQVIITNVAKFVEKAGVLSLHHVTFHLGGDTMLRVMRDHSFAEIQGMNCKFVYYDRIQNGVLTQFPEKMPFNCKHGKKLSKEEMEISSTAIRNALAKGV